MKNRMSEGGKKPDGGRKAEGVKNAGRRKES